MPCDYSQYPADWKERRARVLARAGNRCEFCKAENHAIIYRGAGDYSGLYMTEDGYLFGARTGRYFGRVRGSEYDGATATKVILTIAHLDRTGPPGPNDGPLDCPDDRLAALCQGCHLHLDRDRHAAKAAETRRKKAGLASLF
jgi:hypothetical protein